MQSIHVRRAKYVSCVNELCPPWIVEENSHSNLPNARLRGSLTGMVHYVDLFNGVSAMPEPTKGEIEAKIAEAIIRFEKEYMGRGPKEARVYMIEDMIFVRLKGVLTVAEEQLSKTPEGADLVKQTRLKLLEGARNLLEHIISEIVNCLVRSLHSDISTKTGERVLIFTLQESLEGRTKFRKSRA